MQIVYLNRYCLAILQCMIRENLTYVNCDDNILYDHEKRLLKSNLLILHWMQLPQFIIIISYVIFDF